MARTTARCMRCGMVHNVNEMVGTKMNDRGSEKKAYMCQKCATENMNYVSGHDTKEVGTATVDGGKYGIEFETIESSNYARNQFFNYGFIPTHDGSLHDTENRRYTAYGYHRESSCEYVSGLNYSMKSFTKQFLTIEKLLNSGEIKMDCSCGTHFHVSINDMKDGNGNNTYMGYICDYFQSIFTEMQDVMLANPEKTVKFFGRNFTRFAPRFYEHTHMRVNFHDDRYCWVNCTNDNNVEFRLNKFVNAKQYQKLAMFEKWCVQTIINNFCSKYEQALQDNNRKELAQKTGKKLARKLSKIYEEI